MNKKYYISDNLERERDNLYKLIDIYGLSHPLVIKQSQFLDEIINKYNRQSIASFQFANSSR